MFVMVLFLYFWIISTLGWVMEVIVCSIEKRRFINRGFLIGPYCPIYGFGAVLMLSLSPFKDKLLVVFLLAMSLCSILEYFASYLMEVLFKVRWWDYSHDPFNLNGRICLRNALAFGVLGMVLVSFVNPVILKILLDLSDKPLIILAVFVLIITLTDIILSLVVMSNVKDSIKKISGKDVNKDLTNDIKELIKNSLPSKNVFQRRFAKAYKDFECYFDSVKEKLTNFDEKKIKRSYLLLGFIFGGIVIGLILHLFIKNYPYAFMMGFGVFLIIGSLFDKVRKK